MIYKMSGYTGYAGPTGPTGLTGKSGKFGPDGPDGIKGQTGFTGHSGKVGRRGPTGKTGQDGKHGSTGPTGLKGQKGIDGYRGVTGPRGQAGPDGTNVIGLRGHTGPISTFKALIGPTGPMGLSISSPNFNWSTKTSDFTISPNNGYFVGNQENNINVTLPLVSVNGDTFSLICIDDSFVSVDTNNNTLLEIPYTNFNTYNYVVTSGIGNAITFVYNSITNKWYATDVIGIWAESQP